MTGFVAGGLRWPVALVFAARTLRGGLRGFGVFIACLALGVAAIAGVSSFARSLSQGLADQGRVILGGDVSFGLIHREATAAERAVLEAKGRVGVVATMRSMARSGGASALVEIKAVDGAYPLAGEVVLEPALGVGAALARAAATHGIAVDVALLPRLGIALGDRLTIGASTFEVRALVRREPDQLAGGIGFGPRVMMSQEGLRATGLLQPGSLVRWHYRLALPPGADAGAVAAGLRTALPEAGAEIRTRDAASPELARNIERFTQFLTLVGLTALLVGGVGVSNAVSAHLERRRDALATLKALGASGGRLFVIVLAEILLIAAIGVGLGLVIGAALPFAVVAAFGALIPLPIAPAIAPSALLLAAAYGILVTLAFALWPLARAHDVPVSALYRETVEARFSWPRVRYIVAAAAAVAMLAGLAFVTAHDRRIALVFLAAAAGVFIVLRVVAALVMWLARKAPRVRSTSLRLAIANLHRPGASTPSVVLSLGLGLALLVTLATIDGNLTRQLTASLPERAPSLFFVDIPNAETERFDRFVGEHLGRGRLERVPMMRGRLVALRDVPVEEIRAAPNVAWVLDGDRGITYAAEPPAGSRVVEGAWWGPDETRALVSFEKRIADGLGLKIGDTIMVNVLGRNIEAEIANLRTLDWQTLGINFVMVFSPATFRGAPHTHLATVTFPGGGSAEEELAIVSAVGRAFPGVTTVRVKDALDAVAKLVGDLAAAIRGASLVTLVASVLVLAGALAAGHRHRVYDAVVLKTLGATRARLVGAFALEYALLGAVTALFGVGAGTAAAWAIATQVMQIGFTATPWVAAGAALLAVALTIAFGLAGTWAVLGRSSARVLRDL